jgi:dTMP kinase
MPVLIAVYGNDGAGKSLLVRRLAQQLQADGKRVQVIDKWDILQAQLHPDCASFLIDDLPALRVAIARMQPLPRLLFLFWTISTAMQRIDREADLVLLDGYWMKHAAAEIALGQDPALVLALARAFQVPELQLYLDVTPAVAFERKRGALTPYECGCAPVCTEHGFVRHQAAVRQLLREWAAREAVLLDADAPAQAVQAGAWAAIAACMPNHTA